MSSWKGNLFIPPLLATSRYKSTYYGSYVKQLSIKKQDKALINSQKARDIRSVLIDPKNTSVGSAQFRYEPFAMLIFVSTII